MFDRVEKYVSDAIREDYKNWDRGDLISLTAPTGSGKTFFILNRLLTFAIGNGYGDIYNYITVMTYQYLEASIKKEIMNVQKHNMEMILKNGGRARTLRDNIKNCIKAGKRVSLIKTQTGIGKSFTYRDLIINEFSNQKFIIALPNNAMKEEIAYREIGTDAPFISFKMLQNDRNAVKGIYYGKCCGSNQLIGKDIVCIGPPFL